MNKLKTLYYVYRDILLTKYWLWRSKHSNTHGLILMYHHVTNEMVNISESCRHTVSQFRNTLLRLQNEGYTFVSVDEALSIIQKKSSKKFAVVTFDDVPESVYTNAYPILCELNIPFTIFVSKSFIDAQGYLSEQQILELDKNKLCTVGAHTLTHPMLRMSKESDREISESKISLETLLGHKIQYFAYPYGKQAAVSHKTQKEVQLAGYDAAFGTIESCISDYTSKNKYYLPRVIVK